MVTLEKVVPWGRSFDEYRRMFALTADDLRGHILGCGDGPASFNAEATARGGRVTSCDPIYQYDAAVIEQRIAATKAQVLAQTRKNADTFVWDAIPSIEALEQVRMLAMQRFLDDYPQGRADGRYVDASLPTLPFADGTFDLALSSHLLFLYSTQLGKPFHLESMIELCRVAREVRVFPLLAMSGAPSLLVAPISLALVARGYRVTIDSVDYEFQRNGNQMLRVTPRALVT